MEFHKQTSTFSNSYGLYPYENAFKICGDKGWKFIFVLQDDSLKTVQEELTLSRIMKPAREWYTVKNKWRIMEEFRFIVLLPIDCLKYEIVQVNYGPIVNKVFVLLKIFSH